jgi:MFS family permease
MLGIRVFRARNFSLLWLAGLISLTGDWLLAIALPIYVYRLTGSAAATSGVVAATVVAGLSVGLVAGVHVDRWDRRRVMVAANVLQAVALLPLLAVDSAGRVWIVFVVAAAQAALAQFVAPAEHALLPQLVASEDLAGANSLNALNNNIARLLGPALGGIVAVTLGLTGAAVIDAVSFAFAAVLVALITGTHRAQIAQLPPVTSTAIDRAAAVEMPLVRSTGNDRTEVAEGSLVTSTGMDGAAAAGVPLVTSAGARSGPVRHWWLEFTAGLRTIQGSRVLRALFVVVAMTSVGEGIMASLFAVFVDRGLGGGAREIGWFMSAQAAGGIAGGLVCAGLAKRISPMPMVTSGLILFGTVDLIIFNYPRWATAIAPEIVLFIVVGLPGALMTAGMMTLLQTEVADGQRGRVFAAAMVAESAGSLVGAALAGTLTDWLGVINVLTAQGAGYVIAGVIFILLVRRRRTVRVLGVPVTPFSRPLPVIARSTMEVATVGVDERDWWRGLDQPSRQIEVARLNALEKRRPFAL